MVGILVAVVAVLFVIQGAVIGAGMALDSPLGGVLWFGGSVWFAIELVGAFG